MGLIITSVSRLDDALRGAVLLASSWEGVKEGVIWQQCICR